ncbi:hypothetical protein SLEP1_g6388 [Rubroshorea leprosula]|uniref:E3 ubiquitin-protein ligase LIN n=1 Tax=Rubroshorea leprosula TaxID=152421 RepID=A0AAV5I360_9ROSI|nr:hypothetical protein SLEP1_g6388 [Rubroshorea leprosula]
MMAYLQELLAEEGFEGGKLKKNQKPVKMKFRNRTVEKEESGGLPMYVCYGRKSSDFENQKVEKGVPSSRSSVFSSRRVDSDSGKSKSKTVRREDELVIDDVAIRAVISILSGYIGRYLKDQNFRQMIREKCKSCLVKRKMESDNGTFANVEQGIESVDKLVEHPGTKKELRMKSVRNSIQILSVAATLNSKKTRNGSISGVPNSYLSAIAQLYLSIVYKLEKNDRISGKHLLQVFCDSPFLARTHLLPDLWEHLFLPHLLHLKVWYQQELEFLSTSGYGEKEKRMKSLSKVYNGQMDLGTFKFAMYYKQWLKIGAKTPAMPDVPLPSAPSYGSSSRRSSDSLTSNSSINKNLYRAVFGPMDFNNQNRDTWGLIKEEGDICKDEDNYNAFNLVHNKRVTQPRASSQIYRNPRTELWPEIQKLHYFRFFPCQGAPTECIASSNHVIRNNSIKHKENTHLPLSDLSRAISTLCSSDSVKECEKAVRVVTKAWLNSHGDPAIEADLTKAPVIEGMLEVLFISNDDEVLELAISVLAEFVVRNEINRQIILNLDPQLEIFLRLLKNSSLFLKAAVLLYLIKPMAKQMISSEWVPLVLRVLEFGGKLQTLLTVRCSPQVAAFYFLDQLLTGFNEDRNFENADQVVSMGGLSLLVRSIEIGGVRERMNAALIMSCCIRADGSCRNYLVDNLNKASLLELIVLENHKDSKGCAFALLTELLCLNRRTQITKFLSELQNGWDGLNTMHMLLVYLQRASPEECPLVAAILLQLDLLGDPMRCSVYREEAVDAIVEALNCQICNEKVQEQSARALMMLGGCYSGRGEATTEKWLLQKAGFSNNLCDSFHDTEMVNDILNEEKDEIEEWQKKVAVALLNSGNRRLLSALSNSIANGIPNLARASLSTVALISSFLHSIGDQDFQSMVCSILMPRLLESSKYDSAPEERLLASFSLQFLRKISERNFVLSSLDKMFMNTLSNPSLHGDQKSVFQSLKSSEAPES